MAKQHLGVSLHAFASSCNYFYISTNNILHPLYMPCPSYLQDLTSNKKNSLLFPTLPPPIHTTLSPPLNHSPYAFPPPLLLLLLLFSPPLFAAAPPPLPSSDLLRSSCIHARYPHLCLRTLSSYARPSITPGDLAQAALSVSLHHARHVSRFLHSHLPSHPHPSPLHDCAEQISDSVDNLHRSLEELKHLRQATFQLQMSNAQTWVSAAMTDDDTCLDGFGPVHDPVVGKIKRKINRVARVTSNALYMINRLCHSRRIRNSEPSD